MPLALPNLYTSPAAIYDYLSVEGVDLRLDDTNLATGQTVRVTSDAAVGDTSLAITALKLPLIKGSVLQFLGGGTEEVVTARLTATATVGSVTLAVEALESAILALAQAQDDGVNLATAARLVRATERGTTECKLWLCGRYDDDVLVLANSVNWWATVIGARWLATRRGQSAPKGIADEYEETMDRLQMVHAGQLQIEDIGTRTPSWPFISNQTVDQAQRVAKVRVEPQISEGTPTVYPQWIDWSAALSLEW
jgi:hypothetical protein